MHEIYINYTKKILLIMAAAVCFSGGFFVRQYTHSCPVAEPVVETKVEYIDKVKTEIAYVPKETIVYKDAAGVTQTATEKTDVDVKVPKTELNLKVNDKAYTFEKADTEQYLFEKNKLTFTQQSTADINIKVPTIDNTRKWGIGIGASKEGAAALVEYPIKSNVGGWVAADKKTVMAGVVFKL